MIAEETVTSSLSPLACGESEPAVAVEIRNDDSARTGPGGEILGLRAGLCGTVPEPDNCAIAGKPAHRDIGTAIAVEVSCCNPQSRRQLCPSGPLSGHLAQAAPLN